MATRKPTTIPKPKPVDLYVLALPGGGEARFFKWSELTPRRTRTLSVLSAHMMPKIRAASQAGTVTIDGEKPDNVENLDEEIEIASRMNLSLEDTEKTMEMSEHGVVAYLKSWTLRRPILDAEGKPNGSEAWPLPTDIDDLLDLPMPIYDALVERATKIIVSDEDEFSINGIENPESPTGGSGD